MLVEAGASIRNAPPIARAIKLSGLLAWRARTSPT